MIAHKFFHQIGFPIKRIAAMCYVWQIDVPQLLFPPSEKKEVTPNEIKQKLKKNG